MTRSKSRPRRLVLTGRAGSGKTAACLDLFRERILNSPDAGLKQPSYFILPNREHADRIHALLLRDRRFKGVLNLHVTTINEFIRFKVGGARGRTLSHFDRACLAAEITAGGEWPWLGAARETQGLRYALADFLREVKRSGAGTAAFRRASEALAGRDPYYARKHADLVRLVERYDAACAEEGFRDPEDEVTDFADGVRDGREKPALDLVVFDGFFSFTGVQRLFVEAVASRAAETIVTLTLDHRPGRKHVFQYPLLTLRELLRGGFAEKRLRPDGRRFGEPGLARIEEILFDAGPAPAELKNPAAGVTLFEAASSREEAEMIAREIRRLVRENEYRWSDFMIILRDVAPRRDAFEKILGELGVPCEVHERKRLSDHALARFVLAWTALLGGEGGRRWIEYLRDGYLGFDPRTIDEIEATVDLFPECAAGTLSDAASAVLRETKAYWESYGAIADAAGFRRFFEALLGRHAAPAGPAADPEAEEEAVVLEALAAILDDIAFDSAKAGVFSLKAANDRLASQLETGLYSSPVSEKNRVQIYDVSLALQKEYRAVFVAGLEDGRFPRPAQPEPVLKNAEREHFNSDSAFFDTRAMRESGERFYFYMAATRARERLYLTRSSADTEGREIPESIFLTEARRCFAGGIPARRGEAGPVPKPEEALSAREFAKIFASEAGSSEETPVLEEAARILRSALEPEAVGDLAARFRALKGDNRLNSEEALADLGGLSEFSAHRFSKLANCGYQHFAHYLLELRDEDLATAPVRDGQIFHRTLENAYRKFFKPGQKNFPSADELRDAFKNEFDAAFAEFPVKGERPYRAAFRSAALWRVLRAFAEEEAERFKERPNYRPAAFEWKFKFRSDFGAGPLFLTGAIDRIDVDADKRRALVLDYKMSQPFTHKGLKEGQNSAVPLYLFAVEHEMGLTPLGIEFVAPGQKKRFARNLAGEEQGKAVSGWHEEPAYEEALARMAESLAGHVRKLRGADIRAESVSCKYCDYHTLCRFEGWRAKK